MPKKLFISHSSKTPQNKALLQQVCNGLGSGGAGYEILVDQGGGIYAGDDWDLRLNEWMAECHAAVILFSEAALQESDWVKKEAAILSWRRELDKGFTLIPVLLDNLEPEQLEQGLYGVLRIGKSQCISSDSDGESAPIIAAITAKLGETALSENTPFSHLESAIQSLLHHDISGTQLTYAWNCIDSCHRPTWSPDQQERFAGALARYLLRDGCGAIKRLQTLLDSLPAPPDKATCHRLLHAIRSLWVDPAAALNLSTAPANGQVVGLDAVPDFFSKFTAPCYTERAWPLTRQRREIHIASIRSQEHVEADILADFQRTGRKKPDVLMRQINRYPDPILVYFPPAHEPTDLPDAELLREISGKFPNLTLVINSAGHPPEALPQPIQPLPPIDSEQEEEQYFAWDDAVDFIDNRLHGTSS